MAPQTRRMTFPNVVIERDTDSESSSSDEEEEDHEEVEEEEEGKVLDNKNEERMEESLEAKKKGKTPITISLQKVGHEAGFKGATYIDCPMKPCFLCKMPAWGHPCTRRNTRNPLEYVFERQFRPGVLRIKPAFVIPDKVTCAVIRYHSRRITCLEFHPTNNNLLLSGDKKGQVGVWDFGKVHEKMVYGHIHSCIVNNMRFNPTNVDSVYAASSDGTISCTDLETGISLSLMNLNPDGWQGPSSWRMLYGMDINSEKSLVLVADNLVFSTLVDTRSNNKIGEAILIHKKGSKVVGLHCNPVQPELLLSCGNDHFARIWDLRRMEAGSSLYDLAHKRVVNSAYFSPLSGSKILTTSQDNRLRIWDSIFGDLDSPSREIVHTEWDPKDPSESLAVIGRYISENYNGAALHPIDFIDISTGQLVAEVMDPNITTITPVNKLHPRDDVLASGSSRSLFIWRPKEKSELVEQKVERKIVICDRAEKKRSRKYGNRSDDSDDDKFTSKGKKLKSNKP
ncbi:hypothetical protein RGQ29_000396 [Quercus rubra]|uniref:Protein DAMAGED DNA-BINDING 2 n=1 Tax=Quercus rubra TaxID=3512 RepID=A0AAN7GAY6_QUERU|nr:hypothetical protein RGQ29_000396 [Quercus rubra]